MFEQDYIMRLVHEIARVLAKILFKIDSEKVSEELKSKIEETDILEQLLDMVDNGQINEAEDKLFKIAESENYLKLALVFYSHLNEKDDAFLEKNNFTRDKIKTGLEDIMSIYGLDDLARVLLQDI